MGGCLLNKLMMQCWPTAARLCGTDGFFFAGVVHRTLRIRNEAGAGAGGCTAEPRVIRLQGHPHSSDLTPLFVLFCFVALFSGRSSGLTILLQPLLYASTSSNWERFASLSLHAWQQGRRSFALRAVFGPYCRRDIFYCVEYCDAGCRIVVPGGGRRLALCASLSFLCGTDDVVVGSRSSWPVCLAWHINHVVYRQTRGR